MNSRRIGLGLRRWNNKKKEERHIFERNQKRDDFSPKKIKVKI